MGEISKPIRNVNSILVYKILDRRNIKSENFQKNNLKNNLIALKKMNCSIFIQTVIFPKLKILVQLYINE